MKPGLLMLPSAVSDSRVHNILPNKIETDFQFSRASAATRVNHQGLIENVGYFSDELVQNGNFSELGSEIITNGDFATDSDWTLPTGWTINNGKLRADNVSLLNATQAYVYTNGKTYKVTYTISDYVKGAMRFQLGGGGSQVNGAKKTANGTYTEYLTATANHTSARVRALSDDGGFTGSVDNVSVKQVDPNDRWDLFNGATITNNKANIIGDGSAFGYIEQTNIFTIGKTYKITLDAVINSGGGLKVNYDLGFASIIGEITTSGSYTFTYTAVVTGSIIIGRRVAGSAYDSSVTNISVVEVQGDKPRLNYDPLNPTCPHLLLEPQSTNLIEFSEDYSQNAWLKTNLSITSNSIKSPSGVVDSAKLVPDTTNGQHKIDITKTVSSGATVALSAFVKKGEYEFVCLYEVNSAKGRFYNLNDGTQGGTFGSAPTTSNIEQLPNDWYRISITTTVPSTLARYIVYVCDSISNTAFIGDNIKGLYVWGAMLEQQSYATSYIPTAGSQETRVAETCTNAGNIDTFNSTEGVLYAELLHRENDTNSNQISISDRTNNNNVKLILSNSSDNLRGVVKVGGANQCELDTNITRDNFHKIAILYKLNDFKLYVNGSLVVTDTSGSVPTGLDTVSFNRGDANSDFYGKTKALATYNRALTDNELYTITSTQYSAYSGMVAALGNYTIPC